MAVSNKPRRPRTRKSTAKTATLPAKELMSPPSPDLEIELPKRAKKEIAAREEKIKNLETQLGAERIARHQLISGIVMGNTELGEDEDTVFQCNPGETKISVYKKSTLEDYKAKATASAAQETASV